MPVRLLSSSVFVWPHREKVIRALQEWAGSQVKKHPQVTGLGYFGSYARNDWGVGSDLDIIAVVRWSDQPLQRRAVDWESYSIPVPVDLFIYTIDELMKMQKNRTRFFHMLFTETKWLYRSKGFQSQFHHGCSLGIPSL